MNFKPYPTEGGYGSQKNGHWTGIMGMLVENEIDLATVDLTLTDHRIGEVDFGFSLDTGRIVLYIWKSQNRNLDWMAMFHVFEYDIWICIFVQLILSFFLSILVAKLVGIKNVKKEFFVRSTVAIIKAIFGNDFNDEELFSNFKSKSRSILVFTLSLSGFLIFVSYTGIFTSFFASNQFQIPFKSLDELSHLKSFKIGNYGNGSTTNELKRKARQNPEILKAYEKFIKPYRLGHSDKFTSWLLENKDSTSGFIAESSSYYSMENISHQGAIFGNFLKTTEFNKFQFQIFVTFIWNPYVNFHLLEFLGCTLRIPYFNQFSANTFWNCIRRVLCKK